MKLAIAAMRARLVALLFYGVGLLLLLGVSVLVFWCAIGFMFAVENDATAPWWFWIAGVISWLLIASAIWKAIGGER